MTYINKIQEIRLPKAYLPKRKLYGRFKLTKGVGSIITGETEWIDNIITDNGMNKVADNQFNNVSGFCHVGTGTATEVATDTALQTFLAGKGSPTVIADTAQGSAPYYGSYVRKWRFNPGEATGNISEVGISDQVTTGDLWSRARVKDGGGLPTTIAVLATEWLDVTYEMRLYPDRVDADGTGSVTYDVSYNYTIRGALVTNFSYLRAAFTQATAAIVSSNYAEGYGSGSSLGAVTSEPSGGNNIGSGTTDVSISLESYTTDAFERDVTFEFGLNSMNATGTPDGCLCIMVHTALGAYQIAYNNVVPKDNTKVWHVPLNLAWARKTIP